MRRAQEEEEEEGCGAGVASLSVAAVRVHRVFERAAKRAVRHFKHQVRGFAAGRFPLPS